MPTEPLHSVKCVGCQQWFFQRSRDWEHTYPICGACRNGYEIPLGYESNALLGEFSDK